MKPRELLERYSVAFTVAESGGVDHAVVLCPFHDDRDTPNGRVNLTSGEFVCWACKHHGDVVDLVAKVARVSREAVLQVTGAAAEEAAELEEAVQAVEAQLVEAWHKTLLNDKAMLATLLERKGIDLTTVQRFRLGVHSGRVTIPVRDKAGAVANVRQWSPTDRERKVISLAGRGKNRLFPWESLQRDGEIIITGGECKALLLYQLGFCAITATAGEDSWLRRWGQLFADRDVIVMTDIDAVGRRAASDICASVQPYARSVRNVLLPLDLETYPTGDVTDFIVRAKRTKEDLRAVIDQTLPWSPVPVAPQAEDDNTVHPVHLAQSSQARYYGRFVEVDCVVSAKDTAPYIVPKTVEVTCSRDQLYCALCPVMRCKDPQYRGTIGPRDPVLLELVNIRVDRQSVVLKKAMRVPAVCQCCAFGVVETYNVEEVRLIPQLKIGMDQHEHVVRRAFYVGHGIETNVSYRVRARSCPEPNTQYATLLAYEAEAAVDSLSDFRLVPEQAARLRFFQAQPGLEAVAARLEALYEDLERNVTGIYQRRQLHVAYDLAFHSVLYVPLQGRTHKGWVEVLVIGDSAQGKSEAIHRILEHYGVGEKVDCKGASAAGLLGGLQETAKRWFIAWGVMTLNDRRLVVLEEAKGLAPDLIAKLTDARSSGVVEISKIEKARTHCRARLIWVTNPRAQRGLTTYNFGIEAVREFVGSMEDVRRFDLAVALASGDVPTSILNMRERPTVSHRHLAELCQLLVLWAWSRRPEHVTLLPEAEDALMREAGRIGERYSSSIPLVEAADMRLKLLRLSAALAARLFSTDDGVQLIIRPEHVQWVAKFLDEVYDTPALGYLSYSRLVKGDAELDDPDVVSRAIAGTSFAADLVKGLLEAGSVTYMDLVDWTGMEPEAAKQLLGLFVRKRALRRLQQAYIKTPAFIKLLKQLQSTARNTVDRAPRYVSEDL